MHHFYSNRTKLLLIPFTFLLLAASPLLMGPGISSADPIGKYLNNAFPTELSSDSQIDIGTFKSNLTFATTMGIYQAPNSNLMYVIERAGKIYTFDKTATTPQKTLFLDISGPVWDGQDSGLLGLAFHPNFNQVGSAERNYLYLYYVTLINNIKHIRIVRFTRPDGATTADLNSEQILIEQRLDFTSANLHRGGAVLFGDDGFLYISIGDLGVKPQSQNLTDRLLGGVLRIDVDQQGGSISHPIRRSLQSLGQGTTANYYIPSDNPWLDVNGGLFEEYYAIGCRNPHKMTKDIGTGTIYIGNVGSNSGDKKEEVNVLSKGANFGWPFREGEVDRPDIMARPSPIIGTLADPLFHYWHSEGVGTCVIGGYVYRGTQHPQLVGKYIFGDYGSRQIWSLDLDGSNRTLIASNPNNFPTMGQDNDGELYIGSMGNQSLRMIRGVATIKVPDGDYVIRSRHSNKVFQIAGSSISNGGNLQQWTQNGGDTQKWQIEKLASGNYRIKSVHSNLYLEAAAFGTGNGTNIQQWTWTGTNSQQWSFESTEDGYFFLKNIHNNKYADVSGYSTADGGNLHLWTKHGGNNQQWELIPVDAPALIPPKLLSHTGAFSDLATLTPAAGLIPYRTNSPLWSDGAKKKRWVAIPNDGSFDSADEQVVFSANTEWTFPEGTVFIKHFEMPLDANDPTVLQRLETRFLVRGENGSLYGITYKWNSAGTDADLLSFGETAPYTITKADLSQETRLWEFPSPSDCMTCHNDNAGGTLGLSTHQMNGELLYPSNIIDNQLSTWNHLGIFDSQLQPTDIANFSQAVAIDDTSASLELRIRSYLDANCAHCHQPNGVNADFDARFATDLDNQNLIHGDLLRNYEVSRAAVIKPQDPSRSIMLQRDQSLGSDAMPPLARNVLDETYLTVLEEWINTLDPACEPIPLAQDQYSLHFVSSEESNFEATNAFDGDPSTIWQTAFSNNTPNPPHELQIDLGDTMEVAGLRYLPRQDVSTDGSIADFQFYVSLDGVSWQAMGPVDSFTPDKRQKEILHTSQNARYVRLEALSEINNNPWASVAELEVLIISGGCEAPAGLTEPPALWLSADDYGGSLDDGSLVSNWVDLSDENIDVIQTDANKTPAYYSQVLNFHGAIRFDGLDDWLKLNSLASILSGESGVLAVMIPSQGTGPGYYLSTHFEGTNKLKFGHESDGSLIYDNNDPAFIATDQHESPSLVAFDIQPDQQIDGWLNGQPGNSLTTVSSSGADRVSIGQEFDGQGADNQTSDHWTGDLAELIVLRSSLQNIDRLRAESYLAIKYGIHLNHNYYASDWTGSLGTVLWTVGGGYDNQITGIGRDDRSGLDQRQSKDQEGLITIYHGDFYNAQYPLTNALNPNSFTADRSFILWGNNNGSLASLSESIYSGANNGVGRVWQVAKEGESNLVTIRVPKASVPGTTTALYINRNGDPTFPNNPQTLIYNLLDDGTHWYSLAELQDGDVFSFGDGTGVTFPVEWLDLTATQQGEDIGLVWGTMQEINSDYFAIERSTDGLAFDEIGQVQSAGMSKQEQEYQYRDAKAIFWGAGQLYYRIRQVDLDGSISYSNTVAIQPESPQQALNLYLAPNPAEEQVELLIQAGTTQSLQISVLNSMGQEVHHGFLSQPASSERLSIELQNWAAGIYYVRVDNGSASVVQKLVVR